MLNMTDSLMYLRYRKKVVYLAALKAFKGLDFTGRNETDEPGLNGYEGCYPLNALLRSLNITEADSIIDIGCGKGLFLYYASRFQFGRIDGLEYSEELVQTAKRNVGLMSDHRLHIYHQDAREYSDYDRYNYFFINNPFDAGIMENVIIKLKESCRLNERKMTVIYQFPFRLDLFRAYGFSIVYNKFPDAILTFDQRCAILNNKISGGVSNEG